MRTLILIVIFLCRLSIIRAQEGEIINNSDYNEAVGLYNTARMNYEDKEFDLAKKNFRRAFELNPYNSDYPFGLASTFYELKSYDSAKKYITIAIQLEPNQPDYHNQAGNIYFHLEEYWEAAHNYKITLDNLSDKYPINMENCYYNKAVSEFYMKDYKAAIRDLTILMSEDPAEAKYPHLRAVSLLKIKRREEACMDFETARELGNRKSYQYLLKYCK